MSTQCPVSSLDAARTSNTVVYGAALGIWLALVAAGIIYVIRNRRRQIIAKRQPLLTLLTFLAFGVFTGLSFLRKLIPNAPCGTDVPLFVSYVIMANVLIIRMYFLYLSHKISSASLDYYEQPESRSKSTSKSELQDLRKRATTKNLILAIVIKSAIEILPIAAVAIVFRDAMNMPIQCSSCARSFFYFFLAIFIPSSWDTTIYAYLHFKVHKLSDSLGIKTEFQIYVFVSFTGVGLAGVVFLANLGSQLSRFFDSRTLVIIGVPMYISITWMAFTLYFYDKNISYNIPKRKGSKLKETEIHEELLEMHKANTSNCKVTLEEVLAHDDSFQVFKTYLQQEFSVENLLFWKDVDDFKKAQHPTVESHAAVAKHIYETYIPDQAALAINISSTSKSKIISAIENEPPSNWKPEIFQDAVKQVYYLMQEDSFPRFRKSPLFLQLHLCQQ